MKIITIAIFLTVILNGCAGPELYSKYQWADYPEKSQAVANGEITEKEYIKHMIENLEIQTPGISDALFPYLPSNYEGNQIPPGYYADIGTSYLKLGKPKKAIKFYRYEAKAWPESKFLMKNLINSLKQDAHLYQKPLK